MKNRKEWFLKGLKYGISIALGYLAVSFSIGIVAKNAGLNVFQSSLASLTCVASAGQFVGFSLIAAKCSYLEMILMELITNARYILMSCALSQKVSEDLPLRHRLLIGHGITDEIFGLEICSPNKLNPYFSYGLMLVSITGWVSGTALGGLLGSILPAAVVSALSVGLYGMFLAIIIPPARTNKVIFGLVLISFLTSFIFSTVKYFLLIPAGIRTIVLTIVLSLGAAILFPVKEADLNEK